jgi:hypothetical protein
MKLPRMVPQPALLPPGGPQLLVVVDTEEEFDWNRPFDRRATGTVSIPAQHHAHAVFDRYGVVPTYVMDYPVATAPAAVRTLRSLVDAGRADIGTHCHPWVTPPHDEAVSNFNSFHGNLPPELEAAKIAASTDAVAQAFGRAPRAFKAGRYGLGPATFDTLVALGYTLDCSVVPHTRFVAQQGPDFRGLPKAPFFTDATHRLLEVPITVGYAGSLGGLAPAQSASFDALYEAPALRSLRLPGVLSRLGLLERTRLSPEGFDAASQCRLLRALVAQGQRVFTLSYHSPSLEPGHTPYVRNAEDLQAFLRCIDTVLGFFQRELGGRFTTLSALEQQARQPQPAAAHAA